MTAAKVLAEKKSQMDYFPLYFHLRGRGSSWHLVVAQILRTTKMSAFYSSLFEYHFRVAPLCIKHDILPSLT